MFPFLLLLGTLNDRRCISSNLAVLAVLFFLIESTNELDNFMGVHFAGFLSVLV